MYTAPNPRACTLFKPGHHVHWIQWKVGTRDPNDQIAVGEIGVEHEGRVRIELADGTVVVAWSHDPEKIGRLSRRSHDRATFSARHHLLVVRELPIGEGPSPADLVNLAVDLDDLAPCRSRT